MELMEVAVKDLAEYNFPYGISERSRSLLSAFLRIERTQRERGREVGRCAIDQAIGLELAAIEAATARYEEEQKAVDIATRSRELKKQPARAWQSLG